MGWLIDELVSRLADSSVGFCFFLVGWLAGWLVGWLAGWWVGGLVGCLVLTCHPALKEYNLQGEYCDVQCQEATEVAQHQRPSVCPVTPTGGTAGGGKV